MTRVAGAAGPNGVPDARGEARRGVSRTLTLAAALAVALAAGSLALRVTNPGGVPAPDASDWVPHLWAIGALTVLALTHSWAPTIGWSALVIGSTASTLAVEGYVREYRALGGGAPGDPLTLLLVAALSVPPVVAAAYATSAGRHTRTMTLLAWGSAIVLNALLIGGLIARAIAGERAGVPGWLWLAIVGGLWATGLVRDLRPAFARTRVRLAAGEATSARPGAAFTALRVFLDELVPGREAGRVAAAESERGRIAADLHAEVLPSLRRALAEAEGGGTVERLAADLRAAVDEVEGLLAARRSVVLEEMGLLAALEWLAERTEDRSDVRVAIVVEGDDASPAPGEPRVARPPRDVERAAFRVAQLALDNVVRHAPGATVEARLAASAGRVALRIADDGDGPPIDEAAAARAGHRGIADMRAEARACGATLTIGVGPGGTLVTFAWPA